MLTRIMVRNFKRFEEVSIELGNPVIFIGPNNSGKTSALQALALWGVGLRRWNEKRKGEKAPEKRPGVAVNRRDLFSIPVPDANLLWRDLRVRDVRKDQGKQSTQNIRIDIIVEGITEDRFWTCGLEFDYANEESFYCRPIRLLDKQNAQRMPVPEEAAHVKIAFLPPMSGLMANETRLDEGAVNVRVGEGRTAEVLRNLCYRICRENQADWKKLKTQIETLFGVTLNDPHYIGERGEIEMSYHEKGIQLDLSCSGRGLQQTLLLLSYMYGNPGSVLLLDEPDAHLEILRQRQIYQLLTDVAERNGNQIIAASNSEVLLNEAAGRDVVIAFLGKPHRIDDRGSQLLKSLKAIGFEQYYQAEQTGWVLYVEGPTDWAMLRAFAEKMQHIEARELLERPFVRYIGNNLNEARDHFYGLREAVRDLKGVAILDRIPSVRVDDERLKVLIWNKREIENYLCHRETLLAYARESASTDAVGPLFSQAESGKRCRAMEESIDEVEKALKTLGKGSPWSPDTKVSDDFLVPLFEKYFEKLGLPNIMAKKNFHELARFVPLEKLDTEIKEKLDAIVEVARSSMSTGELP